MRTLEQIKRELQENFMSSEDLADLYGFTAGAEFDENFSKVSLERLFLYIVAFCAYTIEALIEATKVEIDTRIAEMSPGRPAWYAKKLKDFLVGVTLPPGSDEYDTSNMTDEEIASLKIIKHAVAIDDNNTHKLILKIATENEAGELCPVTDVATVTQIQAYISAIKYAGVITELINQEGDTFDCTLKIWYDPLRTPEQVTQDVRDAITAYLTALPFNGEYSNMALEDQLQAVDGVKIVELVSATATPAGSVTPETVDGKIYPQAGYFKSNTVNIDLKPY